jgi:hypothetical protein
LIDIIALSPSDFCGGVAFDPRQAPEDDGFRQNVSPFGLIDPLLLARDRFPSSLIDMKFTFVVFLRIC